MPTEGNIKKVETGLIEKIGEGKVEEEAVTFNAYLDRNFKYGTATITWNKADEVKYVASQPIAK